MEYFIVITPKHSRHNLDMFVEILDKLELDSYMISREVEPHVHYHAYIKTTRLMPDLRYHLGDKTESKCRFSKDQVRSRVKAIAYTMKDGNYRHKNIDVNDFLMASEISTPKHSFDKEVKSLYENKMSKDKLVDSIIELYIKYNRKIYIQHILSLATTILAHQDGMYRKELKNKILDLL